MEVIRKVYFILILVALISFMGGLASGEENAKVNINKATVEELSTLEGIGEMKAESIIEFRGNHGQFTKIEDLKNVKGIGDKIFEKIKDQITVE
ncbi:MAG: ComEA family DNA-binding protein [Candidatus Scalinduaceae bacterium]